MQQTSPERKRILARDTAMTERELSFAHLHISGGEKKIILARYLAMNEA